MRKGGVITLGGMAFMAKADAHFAGSKPTVAELPSAAVST